VLADQVAEASVLIGVMAQAAVVWAMELEMVPYQPAISVVVERGMAAAPAVVVAETDQAEMAMVLAAAVWRKAHFCWAVAEEAAGVVAQASEMEQAQAVAVVMELDSATCEVLVAAATAQAAKWVSAAAAPATATATGAASVWVALVVGSEAQVQVAAASVVRAQSEEVAAEVDLEMADRVLTSPWVLEMARAQAPETRVGLLVAGNSAQERERELEMAPAVAIWL
jgi:hypothetical protein